MVAMTHGRLDFERLMIRSQVVEVLLRATLPVHASGKLRSNGVALRTQPAATGYTMILQRIPSTDPANGPGNLERTRRPDFPISR